MPRQQIAHNIFRIKLKDELGRLNTLSAGPESFQSFGQGEYILLLGLGPQPEILAGLIPRHKPVFYLETAEFASQMSENWAKSIPAHWKRVSLKELSSAIIARCRIIYYQFGPRLFPGFWQDLIARCRLIHLVPQPGQIREDTVCLPAAPDDLLAPELYQAFTQLGFQVMSLAPELNENDLLRVLKNLRPGLFLSVNFRGLDKYGYNYHLLKAANVPVAVWCVDNPFHLLCGLKSPFWKDALLFISDDWFKQALRNQGANYVFHLPLGTSPRLFQSTKPQCFSSLNDKIVFVGRSAFPKKQGFFAASKVEDSLLKKASAILNSGIRPDFEWWLKALGLERLWPGQQVRQAGLGAESTSQMWRTYCLRYCADFAKLTVYGDKNWSELLPQEVELKNEVDYYGPLADIYKSAAYNVNLTSMLLPRGLTQRHFDVFSVKGFLLTDFTRGLDIFPRELTRPISFEHPKQLFDIVNNLEKDPGLKSDLCQAWHDLIRDKHTYLQRAEYILNLVQGLHNQGKT